MDNLDKYKDEVLDEDNKTDNVIILKDETGKDVEFEFLDLIEHDGKDYVVLLPVVIEEDDDDGEVVILQVLDNAEDQDEEEYISVDDDKVLYEIFNIFKDKFKDEFNFE